MNIRVFLRSVKHSPPDLGFNRIPYDKIFPISSYRPKSLLVNTTRKKTRIRLRSPKGAYGSTSKNMAGANESTSAETFILEVEADKLTLTAWRIMRFFV